MISNEVATELIKRELMQMMSPTQDRDTQATRVDRIIQALIQNRALIAELAGERKTQLTNEAGQAHALRQTRIEAAAILEAQLDSEVAGR